MKVTLIVLAILGLVVVLSQCAGKKESVFEKEHYVEGGDTLPYRILYPPDFKPSEKYPLILFLHGSGERGNDNEAQLLNGGDYFLTQINQNEVKAVVVVPQCPADGYWSSVNRTEIDGRPNFDFSEDREPTRALSMVMALVENLRNEPWVDQSRLYVGGLSMGGMGTYELIYRQPDWFAAAFVICGDGKPEKAELFAGKTSVWFFHGDADDVVPVESSKALYQGILSAGGYAKLTIYPGVGHASWVPAFNDPELMKWLLSVSR